MIKAVLNYNFMQNAVYTAILASLICCIIGTIIVEKKLVSMSGGIAHASFGGIGVGYYLGIEPIIGGLIFAIITSLSVANIKRNTNTHADTIVSMFWAAGMAIGILFIGLTPGYPPDMTSYLFGNILAVSDFYLYVMLGLTLITVIVIGLGFNYFKLYMFDEEYAKIMGIKIIVLEIILYVLISLSIVILIKVVGVILSIAMLTIPPAIAKFFTEELKSIIGLSCILGLIFNFTGLIVSYYINIPSGASIILISIICYFTMLFAKNMINKRNI